MGDKLKSKTRFVLPVLTALSIGVLCAVVVWIFDLTGYRNRAAGTHHSIARTSGELKGLAEIIRLCVEISGKEPPDAINLFPDFLEEIKPGVVEDILVGRGWAEPNTGLLVDSWHNPLSLVVESPHHYTFISAGPNGKHEGGRGDDIVYDFDPWEEFLGSPKKLNNNNPAMPTHLRRPRQKN